MSKIALFSVKPQYAERLIAGSKHFEFRRLPVSAELSHIVIYASSPSKRILGIAGVKQVVVTTPALAWKKTKYVAGISKQDFIEYYKGAEKAYCIEIDQESVVPLKALIHPTDLDATICIPQSFRYLSLSYFNALLEKMR